MGGDSFPVLELYDRDGRRVYTRNLQSRISRNSSNYSIPVWTVSVDLVLTPALLADMRIEAEVARLVQWKGKG